jgi:hypothetical protein
VDWSWFFGSYHDEIEAPGKQPIFILLIGLILGFSLIRTSTRMIRAQVRWWPGNVSAGGVHLHHEIFGVVMMLVSGVISFGITTLHPWLEILAFIFGFGAGLVLDEFALLLRLKDVYWSKEGRTSIDAVIVTVALIAILLVHAVPFGLRDVSAEEAASRWLLFSIVAVNLVFILVTALKGKFWLALLGTFVPFVGIVGAVRMATPNSPWARRRYDEKALERAKNRSAPWDRRKHRLVSLIGGAPSTEHVSSADPT